MKKFLLLIIALMILPMALAGTVTRSISNANPPADSSITVTLSIATVAGEKAVLIEDTAPYTITTDTDNLFQAGILDGSQVASQTLTYDVYIPAGETGTKTFSGRYNINNQGDQTIGGVSSFTIGTVGCTTNSECGTDTACRAFACNGGACQSSSINEGGACTAANSQAGTCQSGNCVATQTQQTCAQQSGTICSSTQVCSGGSYVSASDSSRCCVGGQCLTGDDGGSSGFDFENIIFIGIGLMALVFVLSMLKR